MVEQLDGTTLSGDNDSNLKSKPVLEFKSESSLPEIRERLLAYGLSEDLDLTRSITPPSTPHSPVKKSGMSHNPTKKPKIGLGIPKRRSTIGQSSIITPGGGSVSLHIC